MADKIHIELPKEHVGPLREYYRNRLIVLQSQINEINAILKQIESGNGVNVIQSSLDVSPMVTSTSSQYNKSWPYSKKVRFAAQLIGEPSTTRQVVDKIIKELEPSLENERRKVVASVSNILSKQSEQGIYKRAENDAGENTWQLIR